MTGQATETQTYEAATARLETIIRRLDSGEAGLRETLELVREGRGLVELCAGELEAVGRARGAAPRGAGRPAGERLTAMSDLRRSRSSRSDRRLRARGPPARRLERLHARDNRIRLRGAGEEGVGEDVS